MPGKRTSSQAEILVELRREGGAGAVHRQLEQALRTAVCSGRLLEGAALPSTRALAEQLGLSRGVVVEAYEQLVAEGYLTSRHGGVTRVAGGLAEPRPEPEASVAKPEYRIDFAYGRPDVMEFPRAEWLRSIRRVLAEAPSDRLSYLDPRGTDELRGALASYLNRARGTSADAGRMIICNGFAQSLALVTEVLAASGTRRLAMEDPGQVDTPQMAGRFGLESVPIPVDEDGIVVSELAKTDAEAVVVTPAHHFPTGTVLSAERRAAMIDWAKRGRRLILEDDYDAEYRYDREPIGALQGLAPEHVIYSGTASKTLAPGLRLGWLVAPAGLVHRLAEVKMATDRGSPGLEQLAFADFLERGEFDRHLRRMRTIYRARRDVLLGALRRHAPELVPAGASAGLHAIAWLPPGLDEADVTSGAAELGVHVDGIAQYRISRGGRGGLMFGYGTLCESDIEEGVRLVAQALESARGTEGSRQAARATQAARA